ncbi:hypothetical protein ROLI_013250 [Roseobacter fucihabitans]|uniref:Uncharacterized protein n=1 Tax=Roseobacter fucihabitans TaxID=1537242 RepID=A0ABZ2BQI3_9RHOB
MVFYMPDGGATARANNQQYARDNNSKERLNDF